MKLSVVVPVYNVERFIRRCIHSIINQDEGLFKEIELIIVNDGTKDKSVEQIEDLISVYDNIVLINQENQGLSMARNNGLKIAKGDYVWFVDSDDWIANNALKTLLPYLDGVNDIISFGMFEATEQGEKPTCIYGQDIMRMSGKETFLKGCAQGTAAPKAVYRIDFLNQNRLRFKPGIYNEDDEFCLRASYFAETVTILPVALYYYFLTIKPDDNHVSITNTVNPKLGLDFLRVSDSLAHFAVEHIKEKDVFRVFQRHLAVLINMGIGSISKCSEYDQVTFIKMYREYGLKECFFKAGGKYLAEGVLFSLFPNKMIQIYKILKPA